MCVGHFHKREAAGLAGVAVRDDINSFDVAELRKSGQQVLLRGLEAEITDKNIVHMSLACVHSLSHRTRRGCEEARTEKRIGEALHNGRSSRALVGENSQNPAALGSECSSSIPEVRWLAEVQDRTFHSLVGPLSASEPPPIRQASPLPELASARKAATYPKGRSRPLHCS
jgi:hypothetical protein